VPCITLVEVEVVPILTWGLVLLVVMVAVVLEQVTIPTVVGLAQTAKEEAVEAVALDYILQKAVHLEQVEMG
jgi:hypothetical protein